MRISVAICSPGLEIGDWRLTAVNHQSFLYWILPIIAETAVNPHARRIKKLLLL
ncbi:MAG: hypothetical protein R3C62_04040 [Chloroflexota bacterium]